MARATWVKLSGLAAAVVLVAGPSGCSEEPTPKHAAATPSPTASPTPEKPRPPEMPAAAKKHGFKGAMAFAKYFYKVVNYSSTTLDYAPMYPLVTADCTFCQNYIDLLKKEAKNGTRITGGEYRMSKPDLIRQDRPEGSVYWLRHTLTSAPQVIDRTGTKNDEKNDGASWQEELWLKPVPGGFEVFSWGAQDQ